MTMLSLSLILDDFKSALRQVTSCPQQHQVLHQAPVILPTLQKPTSMGQGTHHSYPAPNQRAQASGQVSLPHPVLSTTTMRKQRAAWATNCKHGTCIKANQLRISREYFQALEIDCKLESLPASAHDWTGLCSGPNPAPPFRIQGYRPARLPWDAESRKSCPPAAAGLLLKQKRM